MNNYSYNGYNYRKLSKRGFILNDIKIKNYQIFFFIFFFFSSSTLFALDKLESIPFVLTQDEKK